LQLPFAQVREAASAAAAAAVGSSVYSHNLRIVHCGPIVRRSWWEHLVHFVDNRGYGNATHETAAVITGLLLSGIRLVEPSDGGVNVLRSFFSRSDATLTKVSRVKCNFGREEDATRLITAFQMNKTVTDLSIRRIDNLKGGRAWKYSCCHIAKYATVATA
jgi:hypothetical protein